MEEFDTPLSKQLFGDDFKWGVATAAFQTEGAHDADGKGPSIWDVFTAQKGRIKNGHHAQTACDFYNCYQDDIKLIKELNIPDFRFSISWSRIMPTGRHPVNQNAIDHYSRVIDALLQNGIEPWITLYHWDLPHELELKGGWTSRESIVWFEEYVAVCAKHFGSRVKNWMVMNEPSVFTGAGYFLGIHAPGKRGLTNYLKAVHYVTLATAAGGRILRQQIENVNIGTTFSCTYIEPASQKARDIGAAKRVDTLLNRAFIEPILGLGYPQADLPVIKKMAKYILPGDADNMAFDFDFIGLQCYT
ncbi:MAG: glycosyl hydrolase family protein, partial [Sphingobacteriales bacterium]